ncbi:immunoglobulin kappa light chain-like, partial [Polypterus senegalus]|uniref:immunoglobulin kappa light chain-like n=1 Tax=Polypterus senegalus TaxID=55291 RepID=UPI00196579B6
MIVCSILLLLFCKNHVSLADVFMQPHQSVRAQLGGSVNLACHMKISSQYSYIWIKYTQGELPETIVFWSNHEDRTLKGNDGSTRYQVMTSLSSFNLSIKHLNASDLGTYYCGVVKPESILFGSGTEICLSGKETIRGIFQPPVLKPVQYGDDVTLKCIINRRVFGDAHQVFWIHRTIGGSYQTIRSTHANRRKCADKSQECVFSLQKKNFSFQDVGTYYCALVTCGEVILGNGTEFTDKNNALKPDPIVLALGISNAFF